MNPQCCFVCSVPIPCWALSVDRQSLHCRHGLGTHQQVSDSCLLSFSFAVCHALSALTLPLFSLSLSLPLSLTLPSRSLSLSLSLSPSPPPLAPPFFVSLSLTHFLCVCKEIFHHVCSPLFFCVCHSLSAHPPPPPFYISLSLCVLSSSLAHSFSLRAKEFGRMTQVRVDLPTDHQVPAGYRGRSASHAAGQRAHRRRPCRVWLLRPSQNDRRRSASGALPGQHSGGLGYRGHTVLRRGAGPLLGNTIRSCHGNVLDWCSRLPRGWG